MCKTNFGTAKWLDKVSVSHSSKFKRFLEAGSVTLCDLQTTHFVAVGPVILQSMLDNLCRLWLIQIASLDTDGWAVAALNSVAYAYGM